MQVTNPALSVVAPVPVNAAKPTDTSQREGHFASLLRHSQGPRQTPVETTRPDAASGSTAAAAEAEAAPEPDTGATPHAPVKARLKATDKAAAPRPTERGAKAAAEPAAPASDKADEAATKHTGELVSDPSLSPWLAAVQHPTDAAAPATGKAATGSSQTSAETTDPLASVATPGAKSGEKPAARDNTTNDAKERIESQAIAHENITRQAAAADIGIAARAGQAGVEEARGPKTSPTEAAVSAAALGTTVFNPMPVNTREFSAPLSVNLPTLLTSPDFAHALGVRMSVLASDGVQHAELQLNPAEMGPVSVRIVIDGTSARVDFGADIAATRHAIEAGLPELAGALRDAGFTLTGGGVSQHSRGRGESRDGGHDAAPGARRVSGAIATETSARLPSRTVSAGGVDLYA